jgi:hypothetical protein
MGAVRSLRPVAHALDGPACGLLPRPLLIQVHCARGVTCHLRCSPAGCEIILLRQLLRHPAECHVVAGAGGLSRQSGAENALQQEMKP